MFKKPALKSFDRLGNAKLSGSFRNMQSEDNFTPKRFRYAEMFVNYFSQSSSKKQCDLSISTTRRLDCFRFFRKANGNFVDSSRYTDFPMKIPLG